MLSFVPCASVPCFGTPNHHLVVQLGISIQISPVSALRNFWPFIEINRQCWHISKAFWSFCIVDIYYFQVYYDIICEQFYSDIITFK